MSEGRRLQRIYLDNAATSWPKPESVCVAVERAIRELGAPAGRGAYREVAEVRTLIDQTRHQLAGLINATGDRRNIAFTFSCTDSLCTAIFGVLRQGDHVVTSTAEHNSVLRPLKHLEDLEKISVTRVPCRESGQIDSEEIIAAIQPQTRMVALSHVSNVTGAIQPVETIGQHCRQTGITFLLDAAQSLGEIEVDVQKIGCDLLAAPGHKGLLGPLGTGFLYYTNSVGERMTPFRFGGTGSDSRLEVQPAELPDKFEAGNLNVPGIAGVNSGVAFLLSDEGQKKIAAMHELHRRLLEGLQQIDGIKIHGPLEMDQRTGVFSISIQSVNCSDAAAILDSTWSIQTRAGLHCAPLLHRAVGTETAGGTLRLSPGLFNTTEQIELTLEAIAEIANQVSV